MLMVCELDIPSAISTQSLYRFASVIPTIFTLKHPSKNSLSKLLGAAFERCRTAGLTTFLPETLPNIIFAKYESLGRSAPWDRHPLTMVLKEICATLKVCPIRGLSSYLGPS